MTIHKEGRGILSVLFIVLLAAAFYTALYIPMPWAIIPYAAELIIFLLVLQFFRNPRINVTHGENLVLAPADGKVVVIEDTDEEEYLKDRRKQISIFMSPLNVHVNRTPVAGEVSYYRYHRGKYLVAWHPKSSTENERTTLVLKQADGLEVLVRQIAGAVARRIKCYVTEGQELGQGDEFGFIRFGSRVDVFLPTNAEVKVQPGEVTKGGRTVLAVLP